MAGISNISSDILFYILGLIRPVYKFSKLDYYSRFSLIADIVIYYLKDIYN